MNLSTEKFGPSFPKGLLKKPLSEIKRKLSAGDLLASLQAGRSDSKDRLLAITYKNEQHFCQRGFSLLVLVLKFKKKGATLSYEQEVIIKYRSDGSAVGREAISAWTYPDDPALPYLPMLTDSNEFLRNIDWQGPIDQIFPADEEICIQRLLYNPGRRVTFLLSSTNTNRRYILKVVDVKDFDPFYLKAEAIQESRLLAHLSLPRLAAHSRQGSLFLYNYIPGLYVKKLKNEKPSEIKDFIFPEVVQILKVIHQTPLALPLWKSLGKADGLESNWRALKEHFHPLQQSGADLSRPLVDSLIERFKRRDRSYPNMIHNSFSDKHLLYQPDSADSGFPRSFGILDWDSAVLGPREKDIGRFLASYTNRPNDSEYFLDLYQNETGDKVDQQLVNDFIISRRLLQLIRKGLKNDNLKDAYLDEFKVLIETDRQRVEK